MLRYFWPSDDEQLAGQWSDSHFDEDAGFWVGVQQAGATIALAAILTATALSTTLATSVFSQAQDDPAGNLSFQALVQEDYFQNPVAPVNWPQPVFFTDDDVHPTFIQSFTPDDGDWRPLVAPLPDSNYLRLPFLEPEDTPVGSFPALTNPVDDSAVWMPQVTPGYDPDWTLLFFLEDGSYVPVYQPDEDFWAPQIPPQNWPQPIQPFDEGDEDFFINIFVADEQYWQNTVLPIADSLRPLQPWIHEQNDASGSLVGFPIEEAWLNQVVPVPDTLWLLQQFAFEQNDATGSLTATAFEEYYQNPVVPLADSLRTLQPFTHDQHEPGGLLAFHDEDFWFNPVPPVNWPQPSVFTFDESIQQFVQIFKADEDIWQQLVSPVQATNFIQLPLQQEDDTPTLATPLPPPPPPFCPLPPAGPDADISISIFGGSGSPLLVLFCRVCNSGKPLVIRADYAIWCQDCCAFVSKADTYMGTVRAPGKLKGVF